MKKRIHIIIIGGIILLIIFTAIYFIPKLIYIYDQITIHSVDTLGRTNLITGESQ